jgi:signal transduction histidine kinase
VYSFQADSRGNGFGFGADGNALRARDSSSPRHPGAAKSPSDLTIAGKSWAISPKSRRLRGAGCTILTDISSTHLTGDPNAVSRVIRNLVDNAVRHVKSRVDITVGSRDGGAILTVSDDGPGIAPAETARVFGRFVRLDTDRARSGGGAGLGLAMVAEVVAAHGGTVTIDDRPGCGTKMIVALPQHTNR